MDRPRIDPRFAHRWIFRTFRGVGFVAELVGGLLPIAQDRGGGGGGGGAREVPGGGIEIETMSSAPGASRLWTTNRTGDPMQIHALSTLPPPPPLLLLAEIARLIPVLAPLVSSRSFDLDFEVI